MLIKRFNQRRQERKRKGIIHANHQLVFPSLMELDGLFFQFTNGVEDFTAFFQQHLSGTGKTCAVSGAIEDLDIEIAFQFLNGVTQRRRGFVELCRRSRKAPSFSSASRIIRTSSSGFMLAPFWCAIVSAAGLFHGHHQRIGILILKPQLMTNAIAINNFAFTFILCLTKTGGARPS
jgi:hypothetical protein